MHTVITSRHGELSEELRARTQVVLERFEHLSPHALEGAAVFDTQPEPSVELKLHVRQGHVLVGQATAADAWTALDLAEGKIKRQLERAVASIRGDRRAPDASQ